ncbi:hypothetical protein N7527_008744 [Penicillium freii]|uniref:Aldehyde dehydrogenase domain-containing protein n=1 Tax=Penicillium freii TaxID=48697 RepID=A0A117NQJ6_PENFR|nr:hypothetical protein N7527_008744 [Penicillium freii]KUM64100.1 hypothetical protein ACN42_g3008 [Penicillium freii]
MASQPISDMWNLNTHPRITGYLNNPETDPIQLKNFIQGQFVESEQVSHWIRSFAPRSGRLLAIVPRSSSNVVEYAVNAAATAFPAWSRTTAQHRSEVLFRIASIMEQKRDLFTLWEHFDQGKAIERAHIEVERSIENFRHYANYILEHDTEAHVNRGLGVSTLTYDQRMPVGVFAIITDWNMPLYLLTSKIAPCLAFGCTGVAKPSELASITAFLFAEVLRRADLPPGVMNIVFGDGPGTGSTLVTSPLVPGVSFSGGVEAGIQIRENIAPDLSKRLAIDIKGSCPTIVFPDFNMDEAASIAAFSAFENSGQLCFSGSRIYVHQSVYQEFLELLLTHVHKRYHRRAALGPVISLDHYSKIQSYLMEADERNATFATGTIPVEFPPDGFWIEPTVLTNVRHEGLMRREIFGPVATVCPFGNVEEVIHMCNTERRANGALILTNDLCLMAHASKKLDADIVWASCWLGRDLGAGRADLRAAGTSGEGGSLGREMFTRLRAVHFPFYYN